VIVDDILSNAIPLPTSVTVSPYNFEKQSRQWVNNGWIDWQMMAILASLAWSLEPSMAEHIVHTTAHLWEHSSVVLADHPMANKAATFATIYTLGDIIAQKKSAGVESDLDRGRIVRSMLVGLMVHCPMSYVWGHVCDAFFVDTLHVPAGWVYAPRVLIDQTVWGPVWNKSYLLLMGLMQGERFEVVWDTVEKSPIPLIQSGHKSAAHFLTFALIPAEGQRFWIDLVELLWVAVLSTRAARLDVSRDSAVEPIEVAQPIAVN
jgi:protein Mpv17